MIDRDRNGRRSQILAGSHDIGMPKLAQKSQRSEIPNQDVAVSAASDNSSKRRADVDAGYLATLVTAESRPKLNILSVISPHTDGRVDAAGDEPKTIKGGLGHIHRGPMHAIMDAQYSIDLAMASGGHGNVNTHSIVGPAVSVVLLGRENESALPPDSDELSLDETHVAYR